MNALEIEAENAGKNIYFLAMHVSYWDYIGWKDIYGKKAFAARQNFYASYFPGGKSYTPQMVVNGTVEFIGSEEDQARQHIRNGLAQISETLFKSLSLSRIDSTGFLVKFELMSLPQNCSLQFALIEKKLPVSEVKKGENKGKKLSHYSVVRVLESSANKELKGTHKIVYPANSKNFSLVCFVQNMENREIMAVSKAILN